MVQVLLGTHGHVKPSSTRSVLGCRRSQNGPGLAEDGLAAAFAHSCTHAGHEYLQRVLCTIHCVDTSPLIVRLSCNQLTLYRDQKLFDMVEHHEQVVECHPEATANHACTI